MAELKHGSKAKLRVAKKNGTRKKTEDATVDTAESDADGTTDSETSKKPEAKKRVHGNGAVLLKKAADKLLAENCKELANLVFENARAGRTDSTKLLVSLSEGNMPNGVPVKKRRKRGLTEAETLSQEPEWRPPQGSEVDTGFGGRESEA
jgi:hypothetical protein